MINRRLRIALLSLPVYTAGCGTIVTLADGGPELMYSGVRVDSGPCNGADLPLSLVADTLVLPYTIPKTLSNRRQAAAATPPVTSQ